MYLCLSNQIGNIYEKINGLKEMKPGDGESEGEDAAEAGRGNGASAAVVVELFVGYSTDGEVACFGARDHQSGDACRGGHGAVICEGYAGFAETNRFVKNAVHELVRDGWESDGGTDAGVAALHDFPDGEGFIGGITPVVSANEGVEQFGSGLGYAVAEGREKHGPVLVAFDRFAQFIEAESPVDSENAHEVGAPCGYRHDEVGERERGSVDKTLGAEHGPATAGNDEVVTIGNSFGYAEAGFAEAGPFGCERIEKLLRIGKQF